MKLDLPSERSITGVQTGDVCISKFQRNVHVTFEALAVFASVPFLVWVATARKDALRPWERAGLYTMAAATLAVDGGLLLSYVRKKGTRT